MPTEEELLAKRYTESGALLSDLRVAWRALLSAKETAPMGPTLTTTTDLLDKLHLLIKTTRAQYDALSQTIDGER